MFLKTDDNRFGLVCCFVTNEQMRISVERMPEDVDNSLADADIYLNTTDRQINALFKDNYDLLSVTLNHILDQSGEIIKNGLSRKTGAQALNNLTDIVDTVEEVQKNVRNVERISKSLKDKADQLQAGLTDSKNRLIFLLEQCETERCVDLKNLPEIRSLRVQNDFQNLPNMTDILRELGQLLGTDVRRSIEEGKRAFNQLGIRIKNEVEPVLPEIKATIDDTGRELANIAKSLSQALTSVPVDEYRSCSYYAVLGVCITLAFIFTLLTLGIFIGFCGRQPGSEYSNECCARKTGSSGIFFMFLTGGILMVVALVHFVAAGGLTQVVCEAVQDGDNRTEDVFRIPRMPVNSRYDYVAPAYSDIIRECRDGASAYTALRLSTVYDIDNITALADRFKHKARRLANQVTLPDEATEGIVFLTPEAKQQLMRFSRSKINKVKFDDFASQLEDSIVSVDLRDLIGRFNITIEDPETSRMSNEVRSRLQNEVLILESLQDKLLTPMLVDVRNAIDSLRFLFEQQKQLATRVEGVAEAAERAQQSLHNSGATQQVRELAREFELEFVRHVEDYANFTYKSIRDSVGQCQPLYTSFNATATTFCHKIGSPLGAFWFSLSGLLVLFIPLIIVAISLARLYRKYRYAGYESGGARRHKRTREPSHSGGSRFPSRFEDTSQKAWGSQLVFNNHHTPPTSGEYERPPPYYYPGPAQ
ncbi:Prominin-1-A [Orchesella cincta]|uniref:Prominin-1-A n=1 Tax=Orchesella cincta TaxID=48709 RepID=A0A1D2MTR9_ORCCI|nr:Prominin-1-A [Orchesella cincta]